MRVKLRAAREAMQVLYPLAEALWLGWLQDEAAVAKTPAAAEEVVALFDKAVQDYLSISIWELYVR